MPTIVDVLTSMTRTRVEDLIALRDYTATAYDQVNRAFRDGNQEEIARLEPLIRCATSALNQLPAHSGLSWRGAGRVAPAKIARYQPGAVLTEPGFTSAVPHEWGQFDADFSFVIDSFDGRLVAGVSDLSFEDELLFRPGTVFRVWAVQGQAGPQPYTVYLQELPGGDASVGPHPEFIKLLESRGLLAP